MFRITEDPSSGILLQCLAKNYKNDSIVSVDMDKAVPSYRVNYIYAQRARICCHDTGLVHVNGHDRTILVLVLAKQCTRLLDDGSSVIRNMLEQF